MLAWNMIESSLRHALSHTPKTQDNNPILTLWFTRCSARHLACYSTWYDENLYRMGWISWDDQTQCLKKKVKQGLGSSETLVWLWAVVSPWFCTIGATSLSSQDRREIKRDLEKGRTNIPCIAEKESWRKRTRKATERGSPYIQKKIFTCWAGSWG